MIMQNNRIDGRQLQYSTIHLKDTTERQQKLKKSKIENKTSGTNLLGKTGLVS